MLSLLVPKQVTGLIRITAQLTFGFCRDFIAMNSLLKDLSVGGLRVSEVDELVQKFVNDDEIVADAFLLDVFEVIFENLLGRRTKT